MMYAATDVSSTGEIIVPISAKLHVDAPVLFGHGRAAGRRRGLEARADRGDRGAQPSVVLLRA